MKTGLCCACRTLLAIADDSDQDIGSTSCFAFVRSCIGFQIAASRAAESAHGDFRPSSSRYPQPKAFLRSSRHPGGYVPVGMSTIQIGLSAIRDEPLFHPRLTLRAI